MPSTVTQTEPGLQPIGDGLSAAVRAIADNAIVQRGGRLDHPNRMAMRMAVAAHLAQAQSMEPSAGADFLGRCIAAVERNRQNLANHVTDRGALAPQLDGLTIFDIDEAEYHLEVAQRGLRRAVAA